MARSNSSDQGIWFQSGALAAMSVVAVLGCDWLSRQPPYGAACVMDSSDSSIGASLVAHFETVQTLVSQITAPKTHCTCGTEQPTSHFYSILGNVYTPGQERFPQLLLWHIHAKHDTTTALSFEIKGKLKTESDHPTIVQKIAQSKNPQMCFRQNKATIQSFDFFQQKCNRAESKAENRALLVFNDERRPQYFIIAAYLVSDIIFQIYRVRIIPYCTKSVRCVVHPW